MIDPKIFQLMCEDVAKGTFLFVQYSDYDKETLLLVPQEYYNERAARGYDMAYCPEEKLKGVPQKCWNQYVANGGEVGNCPEDNLKNVPDDCWLQYFENVRVIPAELKEKLESLDPPQELYNRRAAKMFSLWNCPEEKLKNVPQEIYNRRAAVRDFPPRGMEEWPEEKVKNLPPEIKEITKKAKKALEKFEKGRITSEELPLDVFVNYKARKQLIDIVEWQTKEKYDKFCKEKGYKEVPTEVRRAFDETLQKIYDDISKRMDEGLRELSKTEAELDAEAFKKFGEDW